jgi:polyisoprenoid-binding protein YceI
MMVSKVRGRFGVFSGDIVTGESPLDSSVTATIDLSSIDTGNEDRDNHLRSADFFEVDAHKRSDFGVDFNAVLEAGGVVVGDRVDIYLEIEAVQNA